MAGPYTSPLVAAIAGLLAVGCGSRTGLLVSGEGGSPAAGVDASCAAAQNPWLVFDTRDSRSGDLAIYAMRADGTEAHPVHVPHTPALYPSVSPDGTKLLYATAAPGAVADGGPDEALYAFDLVSRTEQLVVTTTDLTYSAISPDGRTVAYVTGYSLRAIAADGTGDRALLDGPNGDGAGYGHPTFADATTVLYGTGGAIGVIGADGSGNRELVTQTATLLYPNAAFSPDYRRLVAGVLCDTTSTEELRIYDYASLPAPCESGVRLTLVSESSAFNGANDPSWGPAGVVAYGSDKDVFVVDPNGGSPRNMTGSLTGDALTAEEPVWASGCVTIP